MECVQSVYSLVVLTSCVFVVVLWHFPLLHKNYCKHVKVAHSVNKSRSICIFLFSMYQMSSAKQNTHLAPRHTEEPRHFPSFSQPKVIGSFSLNSTRQYLPDARNCKYVYKNYVDHQPFDLNAGIDKVIRKPDACTDEKITHLLEFIVRNKQKWKNRQSSSSTNPNPSINRSISADFVCFRGLLRLLMCTPYELRDGWIILATKYKGTIYLCAEDTVKQKTDRDNMSDDMKRILSYGFKFEQFILTGKMDLIWLELLFNFWLTDFMIFST